MVIVVVVISVLVPLAFVIVLLDTDVLGLRPPGADDIVGFAMLDGCSLHTHNSSCFLLEAC